MITMMRTHEIACGHRVFGHESKCAHLHGHNYTFAITCTATSPTTGHTSLDALGRVVDFAVIKALLCQWLEDQWDHKMLLFIEDPLCEQLAALQEPVVRLRLNPTAENIARLAAEQFNGLLALSATPDVRCISVTVGETGKCSATWEAGAI